MAQDTARRTKKGSAAKQLGALMMVLGVLISVVSGSFGPGPAILFFGGLIALIVGIAQRDSDAT
ncbi:membrane protein [Arthrobacter phage Persistence]|uniref:Membrane protein n=1 Tax=Arthrobacter phage Persistence TaxID=2836007 RepID=A0A8F3E1G1_9CAUD|nr:membrane protein [Arthrobacter phage Persistence]QWY79647.1 membrane protein [Arthrobacter phage Persistence]